MVGGGVGIRGNSKTFGDLIVERIRVRKYFFIFL